MSRPLRVAVTHRSAQVRALLVREIDAHPRLQVVDAVVLGTATAVPSAADVVLTDAGSTTHPGAPGTSTGVPVVLLVHDDDRHLAGAVRSLAAGAALDLIALPDPDRPDALVERVHGELLPLLLALASTVAPVTWCTPLPGPSGGTRIVLPGEPAQPYTAMVIASGRGGVPMLETLLCALPADLPVPVTVAQHLPTGLGPETRPALLARLRESCDLPFHLPLLDGGWQGGIDALLRASARVHGAGLLAVVLAGPGRDGVQGATEVRARGGTVIAQDETSSRVWGMAGAVATAGQADRLVHRDDLPAVLNVTLTLPLPTPTGRHSRTSVPHPRTPDRRHTAALAAASRTGEPR